MIRNKSDSPEAGTSTLQHLAGERVPARLRNVNSFIVKYVSHW